MRGRGGGAVRGVLEGPTTLSQQNHPDAAELCLPSLRTCLFLEIFLLRKG